MLQAEPRAGAHGEDAAVVPDDEPGEDDGDDAGDLQPLGHKVRPVGEHDREPDLDEMVVDRSVQPMRQVTEDETDQRAARHHFHKLDRAAHERDRRVVQDDLQHDHVQHDGDPVVEDRFSFDNRPQPAGDSVFLEQRKNRDRIGGTQHHAEQRGQRGR